MASAQKMDEEEDSEDSSDSAEQSDECSDQPLTPATNPEPPSFDPHQWKFHIALIYATADELLADGIKKEMNKVVLACGRKVEVCYFNDPSFGGLMTKLPSQFTSSCVLSLVVLTENTQKDKKCRYMIEEALGQTRLTGDDKKHMYCVRPLHTQHIDNRNYDIPDGLTSVCAVDWFGPVHKCQAKLRDLLNCLMQEATERAKKEQSSRQLSDPASPEYQEGLMSPGPASPELERMINRGNRLRKSKRQKLFCQTFSVRQAKKTLMKKRFVFLVGQSGDGKTATAYHILEELVSQDETLDPFIVQQPEELDLILDWRPGRRYVVLVDDIFGIGSFSLVMLFQKWKTCYFPLLETLVNDGIVYFIATSLNHIVTKLHISDIPLLSNVIDTTTDDYSLRTYEKKPMLIEYLEKYKVPMSEEMIDLAVNAKLPIGFPQCCSYYFTNCDAKAVGPVFFQNPIVYLQDKISDLKRGNSLGYMVLVMAIFEKGSLSYDILDPFESARLPPYMKDLKQACGVQKHTTLEELQQAADDICKIGYLVCNEAEKMYVFPHQSVYDAVCVIFGKYSVQKVIEICPLDFLLNHTALQEPDIKVSQNVFQIKDIVKPAFINRLITEISSDSFRVLEHSAFSNNEFVEGIKKDKKFLAALNQMLCSKQAVRNLIKSRMLYYLTAAKTDSPFSLLLVEMIGRLDVNGKEKLLHDILEGACCSGDIVLFDEAMSRDPKTCENCFLLAAESQADQPDIMMALPQETFKENQRRILKVLVKKGRVETIKSLSKSITWRSFHTQKRSQKLFNTVCLRGDSKMFTYLQEFIPLPQNTNELLVSSIIGKNKSVVKKLLSDENKERKDKLGRTPLHHACYHTPKLCKRLIDKGVDRNVLDKRGATPFHMACQTMDKQTMKTLLNLDLKVSITGHTTSDSMKLSPLHMAAHNVKGWALVDTLIAEGPKDGPMMVNFPDGNNSTPLHIASEMPHGEKMIKTLLRKGADHLLRDKHGKTPLHVAAEANLPQNIECLLHKYKDVNVQDNEQRTPLHLAVTRRDLSRDEKDSLTDSVRHLFQKKTDVNLADRNGNTVIHTAALHNAPYRVFEILLPKKQKEVKLNKRKESPLHLLFSPDVLADTMNLLLEKYPKHILDIKTDDGKSVLHTALNNHAPYNVVRILLEKTFCVKSTDWNRITLSVLKQFTADQTVHFLKKCVFHFPSSMKHEVIKLLCCKEMSDEKWRQAMNLLTRGDVSLSDPSLIHAVVDSSKKISYLIGKGASVNAKDVSGTPILHALINRGNIDGVEVLLGNDDVDVTAVDKHKETALLKAVKIAVTGPFMEIQEDCNRYISVSTLYEEFEKSVLSYYAQWKKSSTHNVSKAIRLLLKLSVPLDVADAKGNTAVHYAVQNLDILKQLKSAGADLRKKGGKKQTCLHVACMRKSNTDVVNYLLDNGVSPIDRDAYGFTPLHIALATLETDLSVLKRLYQPHTATHELPFLHVASYFSTIEVVKMFVDSDQRDLFTEDKKRLLSIHHAVAGGNLHVVKLLTKAMKVAFEHQKTPEEFTFIEGRELPTTCTVRYMYQSAGGGDQSVLSGDVSTGQSCSLSAESTDQVTVTDAHENQCEMSGEESEKIMAESTGDEYIKTETVESMWNGHKSVVDGSQSTDKSVDTKDQPAEKEDQSSHGFQEITSSESNNLKSSTMPSIEGKDLSSGDHLHHQNLQTLFEAWDKKGRCNLLCFAVLHSNVDIVYFLLNEGFDLNQCANTGNNSPLHLAVKYQCGIEKLIDDESGCAELHFSLEEDRHEILKQILQLGAAVEIFNDAGHTPLHVACTGYRPYLKIMELLQHGASATKCTQYDGKNALHLVSSNDILALLFCLKSSLKGKCKFDYPNLDTMRMPKMLIEKGCSVHTRDSEGQTPLHLAAAAGNAVFVNILLEHKANIDAVDNTGRTPLHRALEKKDLFSQIPGLSLGAYSAALCLVERGAKLHAVVRCGETPCDMLMQLQQEECVPKEIELICELYDISLERGCLSESM